MTNRYNALVVVLDENVREDDAQGLIDAIARFRGVTSVTGNVSCPITEHAIENRVRSTLIDQLNGVFRAKQ